MSFSLIHVLFLLIFNLLRQFAKECTLILEIFATLKLNYDIRIVELFLFVSLQINMHVLIKTQFFLQILFFIHVFFLHVFVINVMSIIILTEFLKWKEISDQKLIRRHKFQKLHWKFKLFTNYSIYLQLWIRLWMKKN